MTRDDIAALLTDLEQWSPAAALARDDLLAHADALADQVDWLCTLCEIDSDVRHARAIVASYRGPEEPKA